MKTLKTYITILFILVASSVNAQPMNYDAMSNNARFLTDRMAYTLGITSDAIIDDIYRINYDYICGINDYLDDIAYGRHIEYYEEICYERDRALQYLLGNIIWNRLVTYDYFYRPIAFANNRWSFIIYSHDMRLNHYYRHAPTYYHNHYNGGHFFHGIGYRMNHGRTMNTVDKRANHGGTREMRFGNNGMRPNYQRGDNNENNRDNNSNYSNRGNGDNRVINRDNNNSDINVNRNNGNEGAGVERNNVTDNRTNIDRETNNNRDSYERGNRSYDRSNNNVRSSSRTSSSSNSSSSVNSRSSSRTNMNSNRSSSNNSSMRSNSSSNRVNNSSSRTSGGRNNGGGRRR